MKIYDSCTETVRANYQDKNRVGQTTETSGSREKRLTGLVFNAKESKKFESQNLEGFLMHKFCFPNRPNIH